MFVEALLPSPDCGRFLVLVFLARVVGLCYFGGFVLYGLLPVPIFIGEVLSIFLFLVVASVLFFLYSLVGRCPLEINS